MATYIAIFGCTALILIEVWLGFRLVLQGQTILAEHANAHYKFIMQKLNVQPPLADEKPQPVQVTIKGPSREDWNKFMDFEASQRATLEEFKET